MSFIPIPRHGEDIQINAWNWRPTLVLLRAENFVDEETYELMGADCGAKVDGELAHRIAAVISRWLVRMHPGERIRADLSITAEPKKRVVFGPETHPDDVDAVDLYSAKI